MSTTASRNAGRKGMVWVRQSVQAFFFTLFLYLFIQTEYHPINLTRNRFWCRYICPLGALLGLTGKNPMMRLTTDRQACKNCRVCLLDCQGAANPHGE